MAEHTSSDRAFQTFGALCTKLRPKYICIFLFIGLLALLSTLYRSYRDSWFYGQRKPVRTVGQSSVTVNCRPSVSNYQLPHIVSGGLNSRPQKWNKCLVEL